VRYMPLCVQITALFIGTEITPQFHFTHHDCLVWQIYLSVSVVIIVTLADTVLVLRSTYLPHACAFYALYVGNIRVKWVVGILFAI
ncbi:hypothetical protein HDZ31DRAFT_2996, partial [Schizophyllum fasciatum]